MIYAMSDLHGYYDKYIAMLEKINFNDNDTLYIIGDVIDRGDDGVKILFDMMSKPNIIPLLGNHEHMAHQTLKKPDKTTEYYYYLWMKNGGYPTLQNYLKLNNKDKQHILKYLKEFKLYDELSVNRNNFFLVHGGLLGFKENKPIEEYSVNDLVWARANYEKQYFEDKYLVTGHTPTFEINKDFAEENI